MLLWVLEIGFAQIDAAVIVVHGVVVDDVVVIVGSSINYRNDAIFS